MTGIYTLNGIFGEVHSYPYCQVTEPASAPSSCQDNNEEGTSAAFVKVYLDIISPFPKAGPRKTGGRKHGKSRILTHTHQRGLKLKT